MSAAIRVARSLADTGILNDGRAMPYFGLGVYMMNDDAGRKRSSRGVQARSEACQSVYDALQLGYRLIDTAEFYQNEEGVGNAVKGWIAEGRGTREEVFITTKLWHNGASNCQKSLPNSLRKLQMGYVDLYLMHSPYGNKIIETYRTMLNFQNEGKIRSVGVSNFNVQHLEGIKQAGLPLPAVNQIELHPWCQQQEIVDYCRQNNITLMGYSPLARCECFDDPILQEVVKHYPGKTPAQILIRWSLQQGFVTIPKSSKRERIAENANVFDFSLSDADMNILATVSARRVCWNPTTEPFKG